MFPSFYVSVRQLGAWKLPAYNSIAQIHAFVHQFLPIWHLFVWNNLQSLGHDSNNGVNN